MLPTLVACSHGTSSPEGQRAVAGLVDAVARRRPDVQVRSAFVDVQEPSALTVLDELRGHPARVVPLLLSAGYHVYVDLAEASAATGASLAGALGPDPRLAELLAARVDAVGLQDDDVVVLAAAGSSDGRAVQDCEQVAGELGALLGRSVTSAYLSATPPALPTAVAAASAEARSRGSRVLVATYLLAPGYFADRAASCGADAVTAPLLLPDEPAPALLVDLVLERYES